MTETTNSDNGQEIPETVTPGADKFEFRSLLSAENLATLKTKTPAFAKKILADISALNTVDEKLAPLTEDEVKDLIDTPKLEDYVAPSVPEKQPVVYNFLKKLQDKVTNPAATVAEVREALPRMRDDLDAKITQLENTLQLERDKIDTEVAFSAQLEDVLEHFKQDLPNNASLATTISQIEKKLAVHKVRVFMRHASVPVLQNTIKAQRALRNAVASKISK